MNPLIKMYNESDCEIVSNSNEESFQVIIQQNMENSNLQFSQCQQFEQHDIFTSHQNSTECSSFNKGQQLDNIDQISDELRCQEEDEIIKKDFNVSLKCQCSKSQCRQSYCECFARGKTCGIECGCKNCENKTITDDLKKILKRLKKQRREKQRTPRFLKGCTCTKSKCENNFCSCHQDGKYCNEGCKCVDCKNVFRFSIKQYQINEEDDQDVQDVQKYYTQFIIGYENSVEFEKLNDLLYKI